MDCTAERGDRRTISDDCYLRLWTAHFQPHPAVRLTNMQPQVGWRAERGTSFRFGKTSPCRLWLGSSFLLQQKDKPVEATVIGTHAEETGVTHFRETTHWLTCMAIHRCSNKHNINEKLLQTGDAQIPGARSPDRLHLARRYLIFVGPQCGTCFIQLFWCLEFWSGFYICGSFVHSCFKQSWKFPWRHGCTILWTGSFTTY